MSRFQPQSIKVLGPDIYEVKAHIKGELRAPKFTFEINPLSSSGSIASFGSSGLKMLRHLERFLRQLLRC